MRYVKLIIGLLLVAKGVADCIHLPAALAAAHTHGALQTGHASSAFLAGEAAGRVLGVEMHLAVGALAVLIGGILLVAGAWRRQIPAVNTVAPQHQA